MSQTSQPYRITAVCLGNICRSPMAEAVLRARVDDAGLVHVVVDSAGTGGWHAGNGADPRTLATLQMRGYDLDHTARQITPEWFAERDLIVVMDSANYHDVVELRSTAQADTPVRMLQDIWADAGREGAPQIVALDFKPVPEKLEHWAQLGVTEVLFGLPDKSVAEVGGYVERLAGKLAAMV